MSHDLSLKKTKQLIKRSKKTYLAGYFISLLLTTTAFLLVYTHLFSRTLLIATLAFTALLQAAVQLKCFLHIGEEDKPYWESTIFAFLIVVLLIIIGGSLWIMYDLDQRMMPMHQESMPHD